MHDVGFRGILAITPVFTFLAAVAILILAAFGNSDVPTTIAMLLLAVGMLTPFILALHPSESGPNEYGPDSHEVPQ
ncbi:hypothetical protein KIN_03280 [Litoreibacter roseus]|uniref:Uncharacterized protein n=2 Tax=Litoreibacter roseus TaxID=2601869 RepID=A0A6N6JB24_9RHOB|nr:hypothetical protein KIN_03280 [Litoreibacter roseus]